MTISIIRNIWDGILDLLYPPKCLVCGDMQPKYLCSDCLSQITFINPPVCRRCGAPVQENEPCHGCSQVELGFDSARSVGAYDGVLKEAIHQLKYSGHRVMAPILGGLIVDYLREQNAWLRRTSCIVPIPIHSSRLRSRGFNQSELLAVEISRVFALPMVGASLVRWRSNQPQVDLPLDKRHENVQGIFRVIRADSIAGRSVLLIDDVYTTGSTVDSAARVLREAGAREVHVLTLARSL